MYLQNPSPNSQFLTNIEKLIINDEVIMRLLVYPPMGWDEESQTEILNPLDKRLPNIVNPDSNEYWKIVKERFRKGYKRMQIEDTKSAVIYMHEGRERPNFHNQYIHTKEVVFKIVVHEDFEVDNRISDISNRISKLLLHQSSIAGGGKIKFVASNPREAPLGNRLQEDIYSYNLIRINGCC